MMWIPDAARPRGTRLDHVGSGAVAVVCLSLWVPVAGVSTGLVGSNPANSLAVIIVGWPLSLLCLTTIVLWWVGRRPVVLTLCSCIPILLWMFMIATDREVSGAEYLYSGLVGAAATTASIGALLALRSRLDGSHLT
jgi:uncharacterized membrane protein